MKKILVLRFSSIGDIVLTTPVLRCLKMQLPEVELHFCTKAAFFSCVEHNPYLDQIHLLRDNLDDLINILKDEKYDYVIDLHRNLRTKIIKWKLGVKHFSLDKLNLKKWLLVNLKIDLLPNIHIVDRYLHTVAALGVKDDGLGLDFPIPKSEIVSIDNFPLAFHLGYVVFAIGAQHYTKRMTAEKIIEFARQINQPIILVGGKEDAAVGKHVRDILYDLDLPVINACGEYTLLQSASLLIRARFVVANDTGFMHIAAALKKKIYVAWGSTVPAFGMYPFRTEFINMENKNLSCRPCSKIGFSKCPKEHFKCIKELKFPALT